MKKISIILALLSGLIACENQDQDFPDYDYTTGYFPYQYPVRTLVLGDYIYDNENDNNHKFLISAAMGGVYENTKNRTFRIEMADDLCDQVSFKTTGEPIHLMPPAYYSLSSPDELVIPAGQLNGNIEVQLKDAFFEDPLAIKLGYVIPIRLVNTTDLDSILRGKSSRTNPDPRVSEHWEVLPRDFTMFAVKYINPYHGKYLHRGASKVTDGSNAVIEETVYRTPYTVDNEIWDLKTISKNQVAVDGVLRSSVIGGDLKLILTFSEDGSCSVENAPGTVFTISGAGKFLNDADKWGDKKRDAIHLNYRLTDGTNVYSAIDTLVIRDRGVVMELFDPVVIP